ncbi:MAG: hypothetical protein DSZ03_06705 [Sulfurimonas sp.]|nr:MAG: hypothetical protein DSZ03_06705 [Sulfurimonas sp.]
MLRHSTSFLVSLILHGTLLAGVLILYEMYRIAPKSEVEHRVCLCLEQVVDVAPVPALQTQPEEMPRQQPTPKPVSSPPPPSPPQTRPSPVIPPKSIKEPSNVPKTPARVAVPRKKPETAEANVPPAATAPPMQEHIMPTTSRQKVHHTKAETTPNAIAVPTAVTTSSIQERYLDEHLEVISQLLRRHLYYPKRARKRHIEGSVVIVFTLLPNGNIGTVDVKKSSSRTILDRAAIKTILKLSGKVPQPSQAITIEIPIRFRLRS